MQINESHAGWLLHSTMTNKADGSLIGHTCYQFTSSIDMLELVKERKAWAESETKYVTMTFHLMQIFVYDSNKMWSVGTYPSQELLEFYANHEQALIDANKP
jgi:hypothetical protein